MPRKTQIFSAARKQFALRGFSGASLRTIAANAGVSLTLLDHHFGSKAKLLAAVAEGCAAPGDQRTVEVRQVMRDGAGSYTVQQLVETWIHADFQVAAEVDGDSQLRFLARIRIDGEAESLDIVHRLDDAAEVFIGGMQAAGAQITREAAVGAYLFASGASTHFLLNVRRLLADGEGRAGGPPGEGDERRLLATLRDGIGATSMPHTVDA